MATNENTNESAEQPAAKKSTAKKAAVKKSTAKKAAVKKSTAKKAASTSGSAADAGAEKSPAADVAPLDVDVLGRDGSRVGSVELPPEWFDGKVNIPVMHQVVTAQLAAARQGTHKTKTRGEVAGGGRKPWRQKGTGRARHGSIRSPQWVGGGVAHGRVPKDWSVRVNKKVKRAALRSALTDRRQSGVVRVVRDLAFDAPRTRDAAAMLEAVNASGKALVVVADRHEATVLSMRNLPNAHLLVVDQLNTHDVLNSEVVVFEEAALALIGTGRRASTVEEVGA